MKKGVIIFLATLLCLVIIMVYSIPLQATTPPKNNKKNLTVVLISSKIQNAEAIAKAARDKAISIVYDFESTNMRLVNLTLEELTEWKGKKIDHLIFICHGAPGSILLGAKCLIDLKAIQQNRDEWKFLSRLLNANAKIDFYGSEIGWGEDGQKLIKTISYLTGAVVRASDDPSGNINDADWDLEIKTGNGTAPCPINFSQLMETPIYF